MSTQLGTRLERIPEILRHGFWLTGRRGPHPMGEARACRRAQNHAAIFRGLVPAASRLGRHDRTDIFAAGWDRAKSGRDGATLKVLAGRRSEPGDLCLRRAAGAGSGIDQYRLWGGRHSQSSAGLAAPSTSWTRAASRSHGRPLGRLAGPALAAAARRLHAGPALQQAWTPGPRCGPRPHCRARIRSNRA